MLLIKRNQCLRLEELSKIMYSMSINLRMKVKNSILKMIKLDQFQIKDTMLE
jgi:hypothetical protein